MRCSCDQWLWWTGADYLAWLVVFRKKGVAHTCIKLVWKDRVFGIRPEFASRLSYL